MYQPATLAALIEHFQQQTPVRASSLIISVWGDALEPRGSAVWLGSLIKLFEPFGISERLMRTSIFRLSQDGWLTSEKIGRRSYYRLTDSGHSRFEDAFRRVYGASYPEWDGRWLFVNMHLLSADERKQLIDRLRILGFGPFGSSLYATPWAETSKVSAILDDLELSAKVVLITTEALQRQADASLLELVRQGWSLEALEAGYTNFVERFRPLWQELESRDALCPESAFLARTLLIHEYRKLALRDPALPATLLPKSWSGNGARQLCRNLYQRLTPAAESWLQDSLESADGPMPAPDKSFQQRFN
ncbi:MAG: phenylacetic acid degradation operon negative regulatory protein PaaX [Oceanospirillaceae bacterium]|nr:phenylacetic acid degradation operon negative regulatory protein PaaX [Oceanospirillaceae bacterium]